MFVKIFSVSVLVTLSTASDFLPPPGPECKPCNIDCGNHPVNFINRDSQGCPFCNCVCLQISCPLDCGPNGFSFPADKFGCRSCTCKKELTTMPTTTTPTATTPMTMTPTATTPTTTPAPAEAPNSCVDESRHCEYWRSAGECRRNPSYMMRFCRKTCDVCEDSARSVAFDRTACDEPISRGFCRMHSWKWGFNSILDRCTLFVYRRCGSNKNQFESKQECEQTCSSQATTTTTAGPVVKPGECPAPSGLVGICVFRPGINCLGDKFCPGEQKCCSEGCGSVCKNPL